MNLILGCGKQRFDNAVHTDISPSVNPDVVWDLNETPWPWTDGEFAEIRADDIVEHIDSVVEFVEECHRVLVKGGVLKIRTPSYDHISSWTDPTHKWHLAPASFDYFDPSTPYGKQFYYYSIAQFRITKRDRMGGNLVFEMVKL